jgi:hypothetical protein
MLAWTVMRLFYGFQTAPDDQTVTILKRPTISSLCNTGRSTCFPELAAISKFIVWELQPEPAVSFSNEG